MEALPYDTVTSGWCSWYYYFTQVTAPTMLIHGYGLEEFDTYLPAYEFARAMAGADKIVKYKKYPNERYYVYGRDYTKQMLQDMLAFFDQYLKDQPASGKELAEKW